MENIQLLSELGFSKSNLMLIGSAVCLALLSFPVFMEKISENGDESHFIKYYALLFIFLKRELLAARIHRKQCIEVYRYQCFLSNSIRDFEGSYVVPFITRSFSVVRVVEDFVVPREKTKRKLEPGSKNLEILKDHIQKQKQVGVVKAPAGFGKTNLCYYLANYYTTSRERKRVFVVSAQSLAEMLKNFGLKEAVGLKNVSLMERCIFRRSAYRLPLLLNATIRNGKRALSTAFIKNSLESDALLLIDGFDEIGALEERENLLNFIKICKGLDGFNFSVFIFGRDSSFAELSNMENVISYHVEPLSDEQISLFLNKTVTTHHDLCKNFNKPDFSRRLSSATVRDMAVNPLLLTMMIALYAGGEETLPEDKSMLVKNVIHEMIRRRISLFPKHESNVTTDMFSNFLPYFLNSPRVTNFIGEIYTQDTANSWLDEKKMSRSDLESALLGAGIIHRISHNKFALVHNTFQEYLQATLLVESYNDIGLETLAKVLTKNLSSEINYYFCYKREDLNELFEYLMSNLRANNFANNNLCASIYMLSSVLGFRVRIENSILIEYQKHLEALRRIDPELHSYTDTGIKLAKLKYGSPYMEEPLSISAVFAFGIEKSKRYSARKSILMLETSDKISRFLADINQRYADNLGFFTLPQLSDDLSSVGMADDEVVLGRKSYTYYKMDSKRFIKIREKYEDFLSDCYKAYASDIELSRSNAGIKVANLLFRFAATTWQPDVLINTDRKSTVCSQMLDNVSNNLPVELCDQTGKDRISRESHYSVFCQAINQARRSFQGFEINDIEKNLEKLQRKDHQKCLDHIVVRSVNELIRGQHELFVENVYCAMRLTTLMSLQNEKLQLEPWGRIRLTYAKKH